MTTGASSTAAPSRNSRRRWLQFSLRTLLAVMALVACAAAWVGSEIARGKRELAAIEWAREQGGWDGHRGGAVYFEKAAEPRWQQRWFGEWYPNRVTYVDLGQTNVTDITPLSALQDLQTLLLDETAVADLSALAELPRLKFVDVSEAEVSQEDIERLRQQRPDLVVWQGSIEFPLAAEFRAQGHRVTHATFKGEVLWSVDLGEDLPHKFNLYPNATTASADSVFLSDLDFIYALDRQDGHLLWKKRLFTLVMACVEETLVVVDCGDGSSSALCSVVGMNSATGEETFRSSLPTISGSLALRVEAGRIVITADSPHSPRTTSVFDTQGRVLPKTESRLALLRYGEDIIGYSNGCLSRITASERTLWSIPDDWSQAKGITRLVELADGDVLAYEFGWNSDSGVDVMRVEPETGRVVWKAHCDRLGVSHSVYEHRAYVDVDDETVSIISIGHGRFVERLDLKSGRQIARYRFDDRPIRY